MGWLNSNEFEMIENMPELEHVVVGAASLLRNRTDSGGLPDYACMRHSHSASSTGSFWNFVRPSKFQHELEELKEQKDMEKKNIARLAEAKAKLEQEMQRVQKELEEATQKFDALSIEVTGKEQEILLNLEELNAGVTKKFKITRQRRSPNQPSRYRDETKIFEVAIPKGLKEGSKIRYSGEGEQSSGKLAGDVVFVVKTKKHRYFERIEGGKDLIFRQKVALGKALSGERQVFQVPLLGGGSERLNCEGEILSPEKEVRICGKGLSGKEGVRGDLIVNFEVVFPSKVSQQTTRAGELLQGF